MENGFHNGMSKLNLGKIQWKIGILDNQGKYLTAETFGCKINVSGTSLKKKQIFILECDSKQENIVYIKSHMGFYMSGDSKGKAFCQSEEVGEEERFSIVYSQDFSGKWAFKNKKSGYFLGKGNNEIKCFEKSPGPNEWWTISFLMHPQITMKNLGRQKFVGVEEENLRLLSIVPWGSQFVVTLEFHDGKYLIKTCDEKFLSKDGNLVEKISDNCLFAVELRTGVNSGVAFKDFGGKYLVGVGKDGKLQGKSSNNNKDEIFSLDSVHPQVIFTAHNGKMVSLRQSLDPTANQDDEVTNKEIFQLDFDDHFHKWRILSSDNNYWAVENNSRIQAAANKKSENEIFEIIYFDDGKISIKASNGKYLTSKMNGSLQATAEEPGEKDKFNMTLVNRPSLVLKGHHGFVGTRGSSSVFECNRTIYDVIFLEHSFGKEPIYHLKASNGNYLKLNESNSLVSLDTCPYPFLIEIREATMATIRPLGGGYLVGDQNGGIVSKTNELEKATLWEI